jgi:hypothetical protein
MIKFISFQWYKDGSTYAKQCNTKHKQNQGQNHTVTSIDTAFGKIQQSFIIKFLKEQGIEGMYLNIK